MRPFGPESPWRFEPGVAFLNHGSFGACPVPVLEAQRAIADDLESNPMRFFVRDHRRALDEARLLVAAFLGADPEGLVFMPNATTGVSTVLRSLRFRPGDELITTDQEYNATLNALDAVATESRSRVVRVPIPLPLRDPAEVTQAILAAVTPRTRLAMLSHVTSTTGLVLPIEDIVRELDRLGVDSLVDAAHAPGMVPVDLTALGAAYWTANGHKWICGPVGTGVLHVREDRRHLIRPLVTSHGANDPETDRPVLWRLFDWQGTRDPSGFLALPVAIRLIGALHADGWPRLMAENRAKAIAGRRRLLEIVGGEPIAPESMLGSMAAVHLPGITTDDAAEALILSLALEDRIEVPVGGWPVRAARDRPDDPPRLVLLRLSAQRYVEAEDIDRLAEALVRHGIGTAAGIVGA